MTLPVLHLTGSPHTQGLLHGRALRDRIAHNRDVYFKRFVRDLGLSVEVVHRVAAWQQDAIAARDPDYATAMAAVAEGGGFAPLDIVALNVRYEILYYLFGKNELAVAAGASAADAVDGCTAFAALPHTTASGHLLLGQNWDWIPEVQGAVLHTTDEDGFETLAFTEAGIVGAKIGFNSVGLGLCVNGMTTVKDDWARPVRPFHVRCYRMLRSRTLDDARRIVTDEPRAIAANFLLAQTPDQVTDIEAAPDVANLLACPSDGCLTHANHFVDAPGLGVEETPNPRRIFSYHRADRLAELLRARYPLTVDGIQDALRDTRDDPFGIYRHRDLTVSADQQYVTVTSVVMDLDARILHLTDGPPDQSSYQTIALNGTPAA
jgi:isopenicillin-N N-acyltransferase-like protein